jgi:hypothetical protein
MPEASTLRRQLREIHQRYKVAAAASDWETAYRCATELLAADPKPDYPLSLVATTAMRAERFEEARRCYLRLVELDPDCGSTYDGLAELHGRRAEAAQTAASPSNLQGRPVREPLASPDAAEEKRLAATYGLRALQCHDAEVTAASLWDIPVGSPPRLSDDKARNVIAYTLFGDSPRYCETAFINAGALKTLFPNWTMRVYCDRTVPLEVRKRLKARGAQLLICEGSDWQGIDPLMWRFAVMADPSADRWLIRDADSLVSRREAAAVNAWLASGRWFHAMRDYYTHTELLLAGMIGGCGGVFDGKLMAEARAYVTRHKHEKRVVDQHFLRHVVWSTVKQSLMTHDSWFGFFDAQPFPVGPDENLGPDFHVGCDQKSVVRGTGSALPDGATLSWSITNEAGRRVCAYTATVTGGTWTTVLPNFYADKLRAGQWKISLEEKATGTRGPS